MDIQAEEGLHDQDDDQTQDQDLDLDSEEGEGDSPDPDPDADEGQDQDDGDDDVIVQIGDEAAPASEEEEQEADSSVVRMLRKKLRETDRELRKVKASAPAAQQPVNSQRPVVPEWPTFEGCDYDEGKLKSEMDKYYAAQTAQKDWDREQEAQKQSEQRKVEAVRKDYQSKAVALKVRDFADAEEEALSHLSQIQVALIQNGCDDSAKVIYALGKNPATLQKLAQLTDPVKFLSAVAKTEEKIKMDRRKTEKTRPYDPPRGHGKLGGGVDKALERLEVEAERTGDRSKVQAYKRQLRANGKT